MRPSQYPSQDLANTLANIYPPYPPGFASSQTLRLSYGFANQQTLAPLPLPIMAGLRWDRWNQRSDGTHFGDPGGPLWRRWEPDKITMIGRLNTESSPTALPASQTVTKQQVKGVFVLDQRLCGT
jgi:hypothetical protein